MNYLVREQSNYSKPTPSYLSMVGASARPQIESKRSPIVPVSVGPNDGRYCLFLVRSNSSLGDFPNSEVFESASRPANIVVAERDIFDVEDCVKICQSVLGLRVLEIAKLAGVSRAALALHRKGSNPASLSSYRKIYNLALGVDIRYGDSLAPFVRNVLIDGKTLVQHLLSSECSFTELERRFEVLALRSKETEVKSVALDPSKTPSRMGSIGTQA